MKKIYWRNDKHLKQPQKEKKKGAFAYIVREAHALSSPEMVSKSLSRACNNYTDYGMFTTWAGGFAPFAQIDFHWGCSMVGLELLVDPYPTQHHQLSSQRLF